MAIIVKSRAELKTTRRTGVVLRELSGERRERISTGEIDAYSEEYIRDRGCRPSFENLSGFPASACISVNEEVVHGIPGQRVLKASDLVKMDVGAALGSLDADTVRTFSGRRLKRGMTLAIESMVNADSHEVVVDGDRWTVRTGDGALSANAEDTVAVTGNAPYILTR